jgi:hypothetical protein
VRVDFAESGAQLEELEIQVHPQHSSDQLAVIRLRSGAAVMVTGSQVSAAFQDVLEIGVLLSESVKGIRLSFWQDGLPIRSVPRAGSFSSTN